MKRFTFKIGVVFGSLMILFGAGCQLQPTSKPVVTFVQPVNNSVVSLNQPLNIETTTVSQSDLEHIELWVNGALADVKSVTGKKAVTLTQNWTPTVVGDFQLEVRAVDVNGVESDPASVTISVGKPATQLTVVHSTFTPAAETPAPEPLPEATGTLTPVPASATPAPTDTPAIPTLTTRTNLNVRAGAALEFAKIGILPNGREARILGVNAEHTWWLIEFQGVPNNQGWVSAQADYSTVKNTTDVPVVQSPPTPTPSPTMTSTPTPTPTVVALPDYPIIHYFRADKLNITPNELVLLQWDVDGADQIFLYPGGDAGVVAPGDMQVHPAVTTVFRLVASNARGEVEATVTIIVAEPTSTTLLDFSARANAAEWMNGSGTALPWPGDIDDSRGFAVLQNNIALEDDSMAEQGLETHPEWITDGSIQGSFILDFEISSGDKFVSDVGFLKGATFTDGVTFKVCYANLSDTQCFPPIAKTYTGEMKHVEIDLSPINGYNAGWFLLTVSAAGSADQDWAVWVNPRIERP